MNGLKTIPSNYPVAETINKLAAIAEEKGLIIFSRIDHAGNAIQQGLQLRPTELIIFGNPKAGTLLMQDEQIIGIDLPVKALAWEDASGKVWLTYNDVNWIANRHNLSEKSNSVAKAIEDGLELMCNNAAGK
ncbi:MAG: DUF302 domain-containing protein [Bacteroidota bacterium]|nr:DUF302 domain-containing protein [Bacteroidota bacterium]